LRIDVAVTDAHREVEGDPPIVNSDRTNDISESDLLSLLYRSLGEIRIRSPQSAVVDRDGPVPSDHPAEGDIAVVGCTDRRVDGSGNVNAPVTAVSTGR
jgi:hypothetical protein